MNSLKLNCQIFDLGRVDFSYACDFQKEIFYKVKNHLIDSALILSEFDPVITLGRLSKEEEIKVPAQELQKRKIKIIPTDRAGKTTYHGPGQLVVYFIFDLNFFQKDLYNFLRWLEKLGISFLGKFGILATFKAGFRGVWVEDKKIISIGIAVKSWITYHGMSINVKEEVLDNFSLIYPCGMDIEMTSIESILKKDIPFFKAKEVFLSCFKEEVGDD